MFGNKPKIETADPLRSDVNLIVELSFDEESCSFESLQELNDFIKELRQVSKKAYKRLIGD